MFRLLVVGFGLILAALLLIFGLLAGVAFIAWALIRGRRPTLATFRAVPRAPWTGMRRAPGERGQSRHRDVVDVEAREVPDVQARLSRDGAGAEPGPIGFPPST